MSQFEPTVTKVLNLMKATFGSTFEAYHDGDPEAIPLFQLPCIIVTQTTDNTVEAAQGEDDVTDQITIKVVLNKQDDFDADKVKEVNTTEKRIRDLIALRDPKTGNYAAGTVKSAIRSALLDGALAIAPTMDIEYGINPRYAPGSEYADLTAEGHVTFSVEYSVDTY